MLARLTLSRAWMWSAWQPDRGMPFNSYLFERDGGCVAVDPLPLDDSSFNEIEQLGGVHTIVLTNRDHERAAQSLRERFNARVIASKVEAGLFRGKIDATFEDGDEVFEGAFVITLPHGKTDGEIALHLKDERAAIIGDAIIGAPAGALSILPDEKLQDRARFPFALRRLWALQLNALLLCDGQPLFNGADGAIGKLLHALAGPAIQRINLDEIQYKITRPGEFACEDGEAGLFIGNRDIGYRLARIPPGKAYCPLHWHVRCEEFFYVIDGRPSIRTLDGTIECRPGDFIAFPTGETGAHQVRNDGNEPCLVLLVGIEDDAVNFEACFYPDSDKVGLYTPAKRLRLLRASPDLNYYDGE